MLKRNRRKQILAAVLSAAFCIGGYGISDAYTYSGVTSTIDKVAEDENELVITNKSNLTSNSVQFPKLVSVSSVTHDKITNNTVTIFEQCWAHRPITSLYEYRDLSAGDDPDDYENGQLANYVYTRPVYTLPANATDNDISTANSYLGATVFTRDSVTGKVLVNATNIKYKDFFNWSYASGYESFATFTPYTEITKKEIGEASIIVTNSSTLSSKGNVQTSKAITVTGSSYLIAADTITGGTIATDGDIVANNGSADGGDTIRAKKIVSSGLLKSTGGVVETWDGTVSAGSIQAAGRVFGQSSITSGGKVKGKALNVAKIKASSASIGGNTTFSSSTTFKGGASETVRRYLLLVKAHLRMILLILGN